MSDAMFYQLLIAGFTVFCVGGMSVALSIHAKAMRRHREFLERYLEQNQSTGEKERP